MGSQDYALDNEKLAQMLSNGDAVGVDFDTTDLEFLYHCVDHRGSCYSLKIEREGRAPSAEEELVIMRLATLCTKLGDMLGVPRG